MRTKLRGLLLFPRSRHPRANALRQFLLVMIPTLMTVPAQAQTVGGGTLSSPAVGPAPAYNYGYGTGISTAVLVKNWDFGSGTGNTIHNMSEMSTNFQYHDQFGSIKNNGEYGALMVSPDVANRINSSQPVEGVNTATPVREFLTSSLKTYLVPLNGATTLNPATKNTGNGSFVSKWTAPNGGSLLGMDIIWETRVRYVTPPYFWFALWTSGDAWNHGAEMDVVESFGYDNGGGYTNYDGRYWHTDVVGGQEETDYNNMAWSSAMARYGFTTPYDATQWHTWTWVYKADNSWVAYVDGIPVNRGESWWTEGAVAPDTDHPAINMSFLFDASWGHTGIASVNHTLPASAMVGKYYEWDYSRVYYRQPAAADIKNLALTATVSGFSNQETNNPASRLIDNIYSSDSNRWSPVSAGYPGWVELDLGSNKSISETELINFANNSFKYKVEAKPDGGTYSLLVDKTANTVVSPIQSATFAPVTARFVKLTVTGSNNGITWIGIREFKVLGSNVIPSSNLALNRPVASSSIESSSYPAVKAVDGNSTTRWSSNYSENQWIYVDLGSVQSIGRVKLKWDPAYPSGYKVQTSNDALTWTDIYSTTTGNGATDDLNGLSGSGRYVKVLSVVRATTFGISLWDFEVYAPVPNAALNKPVVASSTITASYPAANAVDGNSTTRWASQYVNSQSIYVDLGTTQSVSRVKLKWNPAYASAYKIQVSNDASTWTDIYTTTTGNGDTDDVMGLSGSGRYVRVLAVTNATTFGISLYDFEVYP